MTTGTIINIQKYCVHDGPGIRTTVFFKGCPLRCWWCHNPESHNPKHEIMFFQERCSSCGVCVKRCPENAIEIKDSAPVWDEKKCRLCGKCTDFCPNNAREYVGQDITPEELMKEIVKDMVFYEESGGGVTFSGGEPLLHADFLSVVLKSCKEKGINTAIETSGYAPWESFEKILDKVDLFLYDLKLMDNEKHKKYMGVGNEVILSNLKKLSSRGANIFARMPIIAGVNDDEEYINEAIKFLSDIKPLQVNLLPYHKMGMDKYRRLNKDYKLSGMEKPSDERLAEIVDKFNKSGIKTRIGGN